jgi:hypothetical protein
MNAIPFGQIGQLFAPLSYLLASGGDTRLHLDPESRLNGYGCRPFPRPDAFTFASSTATSISDRAYAAADAAREELIRAAARCGLDAAVDDRAEALRGELVALLSLDGLGAEIVFAPSGTDAGLHALFIARAILGTPITSVVTAADETGGGVPFASCGKHFNSLTAHGAAVVKGDPIAGLAEDLVSLPVPVRQGRHVRSPAAMDDAVLRAVGQSVAAGRRVLLQIMDHSKLGARCPSLECLEEISARWGERVLPVVDACQMRLGRRQLRWHVAQGHLVLITGSKFFTGPPFSGALLVPAARSTAMARAPGPPAGLRDYSSRSDWPRGWQRVRAGLEERVNLGLMLRWIAAAREMRDYFAVPLWYRRRALGEFAAAVADILSNAPDLELLSAHERLRASATGQADEEMAARTIFPFVLRRAGAALSLRQCDTVYRALNADVSRLAPPRSEDERRLAAQPCHIGQAVELRDGGESRAALRISAGARIVSESWVAGDEHASLRRLQNEFAQVRVIVDKIDLVLRRFEAIEPGFAARSEAAA